MWALKDALSRSSSRVVDLFRAWDEDRSGTVEKREVTPHPSQRVGPPAKEVTPHPSQSIGLQLKLLPFALRSASSTGRLRPSALTSSAPPLTLSSNLSTTMARGLSSTRS